LIDGQAAPNRFQFSKEDGVWKFDLIHVIHDTDLALKAAAKQSDVLENEFIFSLIETLTGKKIDDTIWTTDSVVKRHNDQSSFSFKTYSRNIAISNQ
jgi:hypothetical protein